MLSASEFTTGSLGEAAPLTLVLPRHSYEATMLVGGSADAPVAISLSGSHRFQSFHSANNGSWSGLLIPRVRVEVDETSLMDAHRGSLRAGAICRLDTRLFVQPIGHGNPQVTVEDGLPEASEGGVAFGRWQIVLGTGHEKRVLHVVSVDAMNA